jgi:hypothetical protein
MAAGSIEESGSSRQLIQRGRLALDEWHPRRGLFVLVVGG